MHDLRLSIENEHGERSVALMGRAYTGAEHLCDSLKRGLLDGSVEIQVNDDVISFVRDGVSLNFQDNPQKLSIIKNVINTGKARLEPCSRSNFEGFRLSFA